jgi:uncharacterized protein YbbK (DUF523 family)
MGDTGGSFGGGVQSNEQARASLMKGENSLTIFCKEDEIGFPVARNGPVLHFLRTPVDRDTALDMKG